jgi:hypothetical protein
MAQARRKRREARIRRQAPPEPKAAGPEQKGGSGGRGRRTVLLVGIGAVIVAAAAGGVAYALNSGGSPTPAAAGSNTTTQPSPISALAGHPLQAPECTPIKGPQWVYPKGPPVRGLPPVIASIKSTYYEVFAIHYSCATATKWIRKLYSLKIPIRYNGNVTVLKGPKGYYCSAYPDADGHAYAGACQSKGGGHCVLPKTGGGSLYANGQGCKLTGGKQAFGWNWNVANRRVVFQQNSKGVVQLIHLSGSDTNVIFRYLNGSYQLQVLNTSGIGYLNGFQWEPSAGWKVTGIKSASGAACSLTAAGKISCRGSVHPPSCLCSDDGGSVTINFTAASTGKKSGYLFGGSPWQFKVTKMTPVPYIIPGSPDEAAKRSGV